MANLILPTDTLNAGRIKMNAAIGQAEQALVSSNNAVNIASTAINTANNAVNIAEGANQKSNNTQIQLDTIVLNGDSSPAADQARVNAEGYIYDTLKARLDDSDSHLADITNKIFSGEVNIKYPPVPLIGAVCNGIVDDTAVLKNIVTFCKANDKSIYNPGITLVSGNTGEDILDVSGLRVRGDGITSIFKLADSSQANIFAATSSAEFENILIMGGWNGSTTGLSGYGMSLGGATFSGHYRITNVRLLNCKKNGVYARNIGYTSFSRTYIGACGLHACEIVGDNAENLSTTITIDSACNFHSCPNGYSLRLSQVASVNVFGAIFEATKGIEIAGNDNRNINLIGVHEEAIIGGQFATLTGACQSLLVVGCYGPGTELVYNENFIDTKAYSNPTISAPEDGFYTWTMVQNGTGPIKFNKLECILGLHSFSEDGSPQTIDTNEIVNYAPILQIKNGGNVKFAFNSEGGIEINGSGYASRPVKMGTYYIWFAGNGALYFKNGIPASQYDGEPVVTMVAPPATITSTGRPGQIACDGTYAYYCYATNMWRRVGVATW